MHDPHPQGQDVPPPEIKPLGHRVLLLLFSATLPHPALPAVQKPMGGVTMTLNPCVFEGSSYLPNRWIWVPWHMSGNAGQLNLAENLFQAPLVLYPSSPFDQIIWRVYSSCWFLSATISSGPHKRHSFFFFFLDWVSFYLNRFLQNMYCCFACMHF